MENLSNHTHYAPPLAPMFHCSGHIAFITEKPCPNKPIKHIHIAPSKLLPNSVAIDLFFCASCLNYLDEKFPKTEGVEREVSEISA